MSATQGWLSTLKDKSGRGLFPILEDMRSRDNAVLICSFGGDDPSAPLCAHLAENHGDALAAGLARLATAGGCSEVILYAAALDLSALAGRLPEELGVTVVAGPASPVLREPTALYSVLETGVVRAGNAEEEYKKTYPSYGYQGRPALAVDAETAYRAFRLSEGLTPTKHIAVLSSAPEIREAELGTPLDTLLEGAEPAGLYLLGGLWGCYIPREALASTSLRFAYAHDSILSLGGDCVVSMTARLYESIRELSCQKCVLCREGSWQLHVIFSDITEGRASRGDMALLEDICPIISAGALCEFGRQMVGPALTAVSACRDVLSEHIAGRSCAAGQCRGLMSYLIDPALCTGCGECLGACPEEAIEGEDGYIHMIDEKLCVKCGKCTGACPEGAIKFGVKFKAPKKLTKVGKFH